MKSNRDKLSYIEHSNILHMRPSAPVKFKYQYMPLLKKLMEHIFENDSEVIPC